MFYTYTQNNTGGRFVNNDQVCHFVIVEADSAGEADCRALEIGLYFDGAGDCECCGNRWYEQWDDSSGTAEPTLYGHPPQEYSCGWTAEGEVYCRVYHLDGLRQEYRVFKNSLET